MRMARSTSPRRRNRLPSARCVSTVSLSTSSICTKTSIALSGCSLRGSSGRENRRGCARRGGSREDGPRCAEPRSIPTRQRLAAAARAALAWADDTQRGSAKHRGYPDSPRGPAELQPTAVASDVLVDEPGQPAALDAGDGLRPSRAGGRTDACGRATALPSAITLRRLARCVALTDVDVNDLQLVLGEQLAQPGYRLLDASRVAPCATVKLTLASCPSTTAALRPGRGAVG